MWELEARLVEEEVLTKEQAHTIEIRSWLTQIEDLLHLANEKIKVAKELVEFATIQVVKEYKKLDDFE